MAISGILILSMLSVVSVPDDVSSSSELSIAGVIAGNQGFRSNPDESHRLTVDVYFGSIVTSGAINTGVGKKFIKIAGPKDAIECPG